MLTIDHSKYPQGQELRTLRWAVVNQDVLFPPPYIMAAMRLQYAIDQGAEMAIATNALLIKWPDGAPDKGGTMETLIYSENENNYLVDLVMRVLK